MFINMFLGGSKHLYCLRSLWNLLFPSASDLKVVWSVRILVECLVFSVRQASTSELLGRWPKGEKQGDEVKQVRFCAPLTKNIHGNSWEIRGHSCWKEVFSRRRFLRAKRKTLGVPPSKGATTCLLWIASPFGQRTSFLCLLCAT